MSSAESPLLFVISAPSGGGKTTLCQQLLTARKDMARAITCTTREKRPGEKDGVDYYFLDSTTFLKRVQAGHFLEHATVYGNSYGTLRSEVLDKLRGGNDVLLNIDVQGAASVRERVEHDDDLKRAFVSVFLTPPSLEILEARLKKRGQDSTGYHPKTPQCRTAGNRAVEKFRLLDHQHDDQRRPAPDAGHRRRGTDAAMPREGARSFDRFVIVI